MWVRLSEVEGSIFGFLLGFFLDGGREVGAGGWVVLGAWSYFFFWISLGRRRNCR